MIGTLSLFRGYINLKDFPLSVKSNFRFMLSTHDN